MPKVINLLKINTEWKWAPDIDLVSSTYFWIEWMIMFSYWEGLVVSSSPRQYSEGSIGFICFVAPFKLLS